MLQDAELVDVVCCVSVPERNASNLVELEDYH